MIWYIIISDTLGPISEQVHNTTIQFVHIQKWSRQALFPHTCRQQVLHKSSKRWLLSCGNKIIKIDNTRPLTISMHQTGFQKKTLTTFDCCKFLKHKHRPYDHSKTKYLFQWISLPVVQLTL
jgi:hypothetical protein